MTHPEETDVRSRATLFKQGLAAVAALVVVLVTAPPSFAAPALDVSATENLTDGQKLTISASGYQPGLKGIAIGQCIKGYKGPADCNISGGAYFRDADASGKVAPFTIVVKEKFGAHDCTKVQCVVAGAPLPTAADAATVAANSYEVNISFGGAAADPAASPAETTAAAPVSAPASAGGDLPKTGGGDAVPVLLLGAGALLAAGVGVMLLLPARREERV